MRAWIGIRDLEQRELRPRVKVSQRTRQLFFRLGDNGNLELLKAHRDYAKRKNDKKRGELIAAFLSRIGKEHPYLPTLLVGIAFGDVLSLCWFFFFVLVVVFPANDPHAQPRQQDRRDDERKQLRW